MFGACPDAEGRGPLFPIRRKRGGVGPLRKKNPGNASRRHVGRAFPGFFRFGYPARKERRRAKYRKNSSVIDDFLYIYLMRLLVRRMSLRREAFAGRRRRSSSVPTLPPAFADGERFDRAARFAPWCRARIDGEVFRCVSGEAVRRVRGERSGRRAVDFRRIVAFEIHGGEFCILFVEMKASKTTFCYEPS